MNQKENSRLKVALQYAKRGWLVFPVHNIKNGKCSCSNPDCPPDKHGKHPRTKNGLNDATIDRETIKEWWGRWPDANIGIRTGEASGISVLDIDPRHGGCFSIEPYVVPDTPYVRTGGGGLHYYFKYAPQLKTKADLLAGVDVRNDGGYVIAPPSNHQSGKEYYWEDEDVPLAISPKWLIDLCQGSEKTKDLKEPKRAVSKGGRNSYLASIAGSMRSRGMCQDAIEKGLLAENKDKCNPPLDDSEVSTIAKSISKYSPSEMISSETDNSPISLKEFLEKDIPSVEFIIEGILQKGGRTMISAPPNIGKSLLLQNFALGIAEGIESVFEKFKVQGARVLYLDLEMGESALSQRFKSMVKK